jgi:hypothetical protein
MRQTRPKGRHTDSLNREPLQQLVNLVIRHLLSQLRQDISQFTGSDKSIAGFVKHLESFDELVCSLSASAVINRSICEKHVVTTELHACRRPKNKSTSRLPEEQTRETSRHDI